MFFSVFVSKSFKISTLIILINTNQSGKYLGWNRYLRSKCNKTAVVTKFTFEVLFKNLKQKHKLINKMLVIYKDIKI